MRFTPSRLVASIAIAASLAAGCGGGDAKDESKHGGSDSVELNGADHPQAERFPRVRRGQTLGDFARGLDARGFRMTPLSRTFTPGHNRFAFGLRDGGDRPLYAETVLYVARSLRSTTVVGPYIATADVLVTDPEYRSRGPSEAVAPFRATYAMDGVDFDGPGRWTVVAVSWVDGRAALAGTADVSVRTGFKIPRARQTAPRTDMSASARLQDTRVPRDGMHQASLPNVLGRKPVVLLYGSPRGCDACAAMIDIAVQMRALFGDRVSFVHRESRDRSGRRVGIPGYRLPSEPWLFTISATGRIAARLEGPVGLRIFESAIRSAFVNR